MGWLGPDGRVERSARGGGKCECAPLAFPYLKMNFYDLFLYASNSTCVPFPYYW
jgi:hypothetical protein